jgi:hypothetical protein
VASSSVVVAATIAAGRPTVVILGLVVAAMTATIVGPVIPAAIAAGRPTVVVTGPVIARARPAAGA